MSPASNSAQDTLLVCVLCQFSQTERERDGISAGQLLFNQLQDGLSTCAGGDTDFVDRIQLQPVRCMGACDRSCVVAFTAANKLTFILSQLSPTQAALELLQFSQQYVACADGKVPYKERPNLVKQNIHAVLPPLPTRP